MINNNAPLNDMEEKINDILQGLDSFETYSTQIKKMDVMSIASDLAMDKKKKDKKTTEKELIEEEIAKLFNTSGMFDVDTISTPETRRHKYNILDELPDINHIVASTLEAYLDNILIKNQNKKGFLNIVKNPDTLKSDQAETVTNFTKGLIAYFDLQYRLKNSYIPKSLKYGDHFIEIVNLDNVNLDTMVKQTKVYSLTENVETDYLIEFESFVDNDDKVEDNGIGKLSINEKMSILLEQKDYLAEEDATLFNVSKTFNVEELNSIELNKLKDIHLREHKAHNVSIIEQNGLLYGYLIFEDSTDLTSTSNDEVSSDVFNIKQSIVGSRKKQTKDSSIEMLRRLNNKIISDLQKMLREKHSLKNLSEDNITSLKLMFYEKLKENPKFKVRFVTPEHIVRFYPKAGGINAPYGTSVIEKMIVPVKMLTLNNASDTMGKLARSPVVRKWVIESGNRKSDGQLIQDFKQQLKSKSITFSDIIGMRNVNKILTDYTDIAVISKNGQRFVDLEPMEVPVRQYDRYQYENLKKEVISSSGVPASYLNIEGASDLRENLVNINIMFATSVDNIQTNYENSIDELIDKIFKTLLQLNNIKEQPFKLSAHTNIFFNHPTILKIQANEALINSVANITQIFATSKLPISPSVLFKEYLTNIDIDSLIKKTEKEQDELKKKELLVDKGEGDEYTDQY